MGQGLGCRLGPPLCMGFWARPEWLHQPSRPPPLQDAGMGTLLGEGAEAALEERLQAAKWDLALTPRRAPSWERLAVEYHVAADDLLVCGPDGEWRGC